jgi:hypothetical protein
MSKGIQHFALSKWAPPRTLRNEEGDGIRITIPRTSYDIVVKHLTNARAGEVLHGTGHS